MFTDCPSKDIYTNLVYIVGGIAADALINSLRYPKPIAIKMAHQTGKVAIQIDWLKATYSEGAD